MKRQWLLCVICVLFITALLHVADSATQELPDKDKLDTLNEPEQKWGYVDVRPGAHMFWWLYYTTHSSGIHKRPLIIWLQGGPGASSTGFGNFQELGPLDVDLKPRNTTWVSTASVLFIDNPVGTGYSYVDDESAYTTNVSMIAQDLVTLAKTFFKSFEDFQDRPLYIFSESYGGKMTAAFGQALYKAMKSGAVPCNLKGVGLGDSWISPIDYVLTWGPYLYTTSLIDKQGLDQIMKVGNQCKNALDSGDFARSTELWSKAEDVCNEITGGVNFYNILDWNPNYSPRKHKSHIERLHAVHVAPFHANSLADLMNGRIKKKLNIPANVTWGGQSGAVFQRQSGDFMKPVIDIVDDLLTNTDLQVAVYNGQLDLICDTMGTELWVDKLKWQGLKGFNSALRKQLKRQEASEPWGYLKQYKNFKFFWVLEAGHMVPLDAGEATLDMLSLIIE